MQNDNCVEYHLTTNTPMPLLITRADLIYALSKPQLFYSDTCDLIAWALENVSCGGENILCTYTLDALDNAISLFGADEMKWAAHWLKCEGDVIR